MTQPAAHLLATADWHLSDRPEHEYRWDIFDYIIKQAKDWRPSGIVIAGDITDKKDNHSNAFVVRLLDRFNELTMRTGCNISMIAGNHDAIGNGEPLIEAISRALNGVKLYRTATMSIALRNFKVGFLPHGQPFNAELFAECRAVFMHEHYRGATTPEGHVIPGGVKRPRRPSKRTRMFAGDIHNPQKVGNVQYLGAPHPVRFGDDFVPGLWRIGPRLAEFTPRDTVRFIQCRATTVKRLKTIDVKRGDRLRVHANMKRLATQEAFEAFADRAHRWAEERGIVIDIKATKTAVAMPSSAPRVSEQDIEAVMLRWAYEAQLDEKDLSDGISMAMQV